MLKDNGIVFGSGSMILGWHEEMSLPRVIADRFNRNQDVDYGYITSFCVFDGRVFDAGYQGVVRDTTTGEEIGEPQRDFIFGLAQFDGKMLAIREGRKFSASMKVLYDVPTNKTLFAMPFESEGYPLNPRGHSFFIASDRHNLYLSSQNIIKVKLDGGKVSAERLNESLADSIYLATNGDQVLAVYDQGPLVNPDGVAVLGLPDLFRMTYFPAGTSGFGHPQMIALAGNTLIYGGKNSFYAIPITEEMQTNINGVQSKPHLLLQNAYRNTGVFGRGNPLVAIPRDDLENILLQAGRRMHQ